MGGATIPFAFYMDTLYILVTLSMVLIFCGFKLLDIGLLEVATSLANPLSMDFWDTVIQLVYGVFYISTGAGLLFMSLNVLPLQ